MNFIKIDAQERFLSKLKGDSDPEQKRKIIGDEFVYCFDEESAKLKADLKAGKKLKYLSGKSIGLIFPTLNRL